VNVVEVEILEAAKVELFTGSGYAVGVSRDDGPPDL
jgi:hypothetical protein